MAISKNNKIHPITCYDLVNCEKPVTVELSVPTYKIYVVI